jgi:hypothetical protein
MLLKLNLPSFNPWSSKVDWDNFGDEYDSVKLLRHHISKDALDWIDTTELKPISCHIQTVFPNKTPPMFIDAPWCTVDNHTRLFWVYDVPVVYTWYNITEPLGAENQDNLIMNPGEYEEAKWSDPPTGWIAKPDVLEVAGSEIINPGEVALVNIGIPHTFKVTSEARARMFSIGMEDKSRIISLNGTTFDNAREKICSQPT